MKTINQTLLLLFVTINLFAQKGPSFGKIDITDLQSKECSYEKDAEAECLYDYGEVNYFINGNSFTNERIVWCRIKVYNEKGLDRANIKVPYYSKGNLVNVAKITGYTYNLNSKGEVERVEMEKNAIYRQKVSETFDEMVFSLPQVKAGSVFEYKYTVIKKDILELDGWTFQQKIPVRHSKYDVGIPTVLGFNYRYTRRMQVEESEASGTADVRRRIFEMKNIPSLKNEPFMSSDNDYFQRLEFQLSGIGGRTLPGTNWKSFAELLLEDEDFGLQIKKHVLKNLPLEEELSKITNPIDKIKTIYRFVQKNVEWNGNSNIWCSSGVKKALEVKKGNSADINLLLVSLLHDAGIDAHPVLVSTRPNGKINTSFPFRSQFDNVYAFVSIDNSTYVMDASNKYNPYNIVPWDVQFTNAFVVNKSLPQIIALGNIKAKYKLTTILQSEIDAEGQIKGTAKSYAADYARVERMKNLEKGKKEFKEKYYTSPHKDFSFDSVEIRNEDKDSIDLECVTTYKSELTKNGDYFLYNLNFLTGLDENPFLAEERVSSVEFGYNQMHILTGSVTFHESLVPEELPKNIKMIMPDSSIIIQRICQVTGNMLSFRIMLQINRPLYFPDEYLDFKEFYAAMLETINEPIVLKKKTRP
jgi:Domain of Unknown Function with PDB structure (DUF3857)/Transglutaminase-like superfamily